MNITKEILMREYPLILPINHDRIIDIVTRFGKWDDSEIVRKFEDPEEWYKPSLDPYRLDLLINPLASISERWWQICENTNISLPELTIEQRKEELFKPNPDPNYFYGEQKYIQEYDELSQQIFINTNHYRDYNDLFEVSAWLYMSFEKIDKIEAFMKNEAVFMKDNEIVFDNEKKQNFLDFFHPLFSKNMPPFIYETSMSKRAVVTYLPLIMETMYRNMVINLYIKRYDELLR